MIQKNSLFRAISLGKSHFLKTKSVISCDIEQACPSFKNLSNTFSKNSCGIFWTSLVGNSLL